MVEMLTAGQSDYERVLQMWNELDVPDNLLVVQVTLEGIVMTPPSGVRHSRTVEKLHRALVRTFDEDYEVHQTVGLGVGTEPGIFVPDLMVVSPKATASPVLAEDVLLAVEVTSPSNAANDRVRKYHAYARGGVPQYLLIDALAAEGPTVTLFTEPSGDEYTQALSVSYGESITLPHPFPVVIDTSLFPLTDDD